MTEEKITTKKPPQKQKWKQIKTGKSTLGRVGGVKVQHLLHSEELQPPVLCFYLLEFYNK